MRVWRKLRRLVKHNRRKRESPIPVLKRRQLLIRSHNETLSVAMRVSNPDCSPAGIDG
jgi:hypothetical protein